VGEKTKTKQSKQKACESPSSLSVAQGSSCLGSMKETIVKDGLRNGSKHVVILPKMHSPM
jgi:hypothetical protein